MSHRRLLLQGDARSLVLRQPAILLQSITNGVFVLRRSTDSVRFDGRKETAFIARAR